MRVCSVDGCGRALLARGWCGAHYTRWHKHGDPLAHVEVGHRAGLPAAPLLALFPAAPATEIAASCGVCARQVRRWRRGVALMPITADRIATRLGRHISELWPDA